MGRPNSQELIALSDFLYTFLPGLNAEFAALQLSLAYETCALITLLAVVGLLFAEWRQIALGRWLFKPVASLGFILAAWLLDPLSSSYGSYIFLGLILSMIGDVCLIPQGSGKIFLLGVGSFLLAHVAYTAAFFFVAFHPAGLFGVLVPMSAIAFFIYKWLSPDVPDKLQKPILGYVIVITFMVSISIAVVIAQPDFQYLAVAATLFWLSDISVARARFKQADFFNKVWGIPFYFGAQLLFALTVVHGVQMQP